ncbi:hypothetical protein Pfo_030202, partial [Paulownia fortunei]
LDKELAFIRCGFILLSTENDISRLSRLYFVEIQNEVENIMNIMKNSTLFEVTMKKLKKILEGNPYAKFIRILKDYLSRNDVQQYISKDMKLDQRLYSSPTVDEIRHYHIYRIKYYYGCYDLLQYLLPLPRANDVITPSRFSSAEDVLSLK